MFSRTIVQKMAQPSSGSDHELDCSTGKTMNLSIHGKDLTIAGGLVNLFIVERHNVEIWQMSTGWVGGSCHTLLAVSPLAATRSAPTTTAWHRLDASSGAAAESAMSVAGMPSVTSSNAVSRAP